MHVFIIHISWIHHFNKRVKFPESSILTSWSHDFNLDSTSWINVLSVTILTSQNHDFNLTKWRVQLHEITISTCVISAHDITISTSLRNLDTDDIEWV
jgi:hypothetical protein